jgi:hypothetical protein
MFVYVVTWNNNYGGSKVDCVFKLKKDAVKYIAIQQKEFSHLGYQIHKEEVREGNN